MLYLPDTRSYFFPCALMVFTMPLSRLLMQGPPGGARDSGIASIGRTLQPSEVNMTIPSCVMVLSQDLRSESS